MQTHFEKTLYKAHSSGAVGSWSVVVTGEDKMATMVVSSRKKLDGAEVKTPTEYNKGKNIGRANETSPLQQAILEAEIFCFLSCTSSFLSVVLLPIL